MNLHLLSFQPQQQQPATFTPRAACRVPHAACRLPFAVLCSIANDGGKVRTNRSEKERLLKAVQKPRLRLCFYFTACLRVSTMAVLKKNKSFSYVFSSFPEEAKSTNCFLSAEGNRLQFSNLVSISQCKPKEKVRFLQL